MNARVFLLVLVSAFFLAVWDGDQAAMQTALARRSQHNSQQIAALKSDARELAVQQAGDHPMQTVSITLEHSAPDSTATLPKATDDVPSQTVMNSSDVPLPPGITAGTYQAVNQAGETVRLDVSNRSDAPNRDFYMVDAQNGDRWYLIRVNQ